MPETTGLIRIVVEDAPQQSSRAAPAPRDAGPSSGQPVFPSPNTSPNTSPAPVGPPPIRSAVSFEQMTRAIIADPGMKKLGMTPESLGKMPREFVEGLYSEIAKASPKPSAVPEAKVPRDSSMSQPVKSIDLESSHFAALTEAVRGLTGRLERMPAPVAMQANPDAPPPERPSAEVKVAGRAVEPPARSVVPKTTPFAREPIQRPVPSPAKASVGIDAEPINRLNDSIRTLIDRIEKAAIPAASPRPGDRVGQLPLAKETAEAKPTKAAVGEPLPAPSPRPQPAQPVAASAAPQPQPIKPATAPPAPRKVTLDDFASPTPRPRPVKVEDFGFRPVARLAPGPVQSRVLAHGPVKQFRSQWTARGAMKDLKGYLPAGIGQKLGHKFKDIGTGYKMGSAKAAAGGASRVGTMAAGARVAALAAGPAAVFTAVALAADMAAKSTQKAADSIEGMGRQAARFAKNDHLGMFNAAVDGAKDGLKQIPIVGEFFASKVSLAVAPINAMATAANAFVERGKELSGFSGALAAADVKADVRALLGDIREAQVMGESLSRVTDARSRVDEGLREMILPIKELLSRSLAFLMERSAEIVEGIVQLRNLGAEGTIKILEAIKMMNPLFGGAIDRLIRFIRELFDPAAAGDIITGLLGAGDPLAGIGPIPGAPLGIPGAAPFGT